MQKMIKVLYGMGTGRGYKAIHEDIGEHRELQQTRLPNVNLETANGDLEDKLKEKKYDVIILHIGTNQDYIQALMKCKKLGRKAKIIAESSEYPAKKSVIERYFDTYVSPAFPLSKVLNQAGFNINKYPKRSKNRDKIRQN